MQIEQISNQIRKLSNDRVNINSLQPTSCNASMLRVFDYIKDKEVNTDLESYPNTIPANTAKWYKTFSDYSPSTPIAIAFVDNRDANNKYTILIDLFGATCSDVCGNPLRHCEDICNNVSGPCIFTMTINLVTGITYTIPDAEIDYAMSLLGFTKSNLLLYAGIAVLGIGAIYVLTRK